MKKQIKQLLQKIKTPFRKKASQDLPPAPGQKSQKGLTGVFKGLKQKALKRQKNTPIRRPSRASGLGKISQNVSEFTKNLFQPSFRPAINRWFLASLFICIAISVGKTTGIFLTGAKPLLETKTIPFNPPPPSIQPAEVNTVLAKNLFDAQIDQKVRDLPPEKKKEIKEDVPCLAADKKSSLGYKLINTVVLQDSVKSVAAVQVRSETESFREGDKIGGGQAKIGRIERLKLIFKNLKTGDCEYIENSNVNFKPIASSRILPPKQGKQLISKTRPKGIKTDGKNFKICRSFMNRKLQDMNSVLTAAKGEPFPNPDGTLSFRITQVQPGGIFSFLDVQDDDVITEVNGRKIKALNEVMELFSNITKVANLSLTIDRGGSVVNKEYNFDNSKDCESKD